MPSISFQYAPTPDNCCSPSYRYNQIVAPSKGPSRVPAPPMTVCMTSCADVSSESSEEHTSELQSHMRISYAVFCLKKQNTIYDIMHTSASHITNVIHYY